MTHSEGFFPPEYDAPLAFPDGSNTKVDGVAKNFAPQSEPDPLTALVDGVPMGASRDGHDDPLPDPDGSETKVDGVAKNFSPPDEPPALTANIDGVPMQTSRDGHDDPSNDPDGGSWTLTPS